MAGTETPETDQFSPFSAFFFARIGSVLGSVPLSPDNPDMQKKGYGYTLTTMVVIMSTLLVLQSMV